MTNNKYLIVVAVLLIGVFSFTSCELLEDVSTVSITERIELFEDDVNSGIDTDIAENFHPDMESKLQANWGPIFTLGGPLDESHRPMNFASPTITSTSVSGEMLAEGIYIDDDDLSGSYSMTMKEDGSDKWYIKAIELNGIDYLSGLSLK